jgi:hypothetical protein
MCPLSQAIFDDKLHVCLILGIKRQWLKYTESTTDDVDKRIFVVGAAIKNVSYRLVQRILLLSEFLPNYLKRVSAQVYKRLKFVADAPLLNL